jgi:hypothetical protein
VSPKNSYDEIPQNVTAFGDRAFKVIKVKINYIGMT